MDHAQPYQTQSSLLELQTVCGRAQDPKIQWTLNLSSITTISLLNFLCADIKVRDRHHLMFATDQQLDHLQRAKGWYIDGTFKLCRRPFVQLLSINAFVRKHDHVKQVQ